MIVLPDELGCSRTISRSRRCADRRMPGLFTAAFIAGLRPRAMPGPARSGEIVTSGDTVGLAAAPGL